jgi:uncharacterized Ntn-hydrolase superfamily protein
MANGFLDGLTALEILDLLKATDPDLEIHQYGLADLEGTSATFTGSKTMNFAGGLIGQSGPLVYAIQGNIITGEEVLIAAEKALVLTPGDLGQKLMAAMHAAKYFGGDGRCSCKGWAPTSCGAPPVKVNKKGTDKVWKSAHIGYMTIARIGDVDGVFSKPTGFANGSYYMDLNVVQTHPTDPVDILQTLFDKFRLDRAGHADHIHTEKTIYPKKIKADGSSRAKLCIALMDIDDLAITHGGAVVTVTHDAQSAGATTIGPVKDHGDGTYSVWLYAGFTAGTDLFRVVVEDRMGLVNLTPVTLYPFPTLVVETLAP